MLHYRFSYSQAHRHFIDIEFTVNNHSGSELILQLPAWRPGRYELGDFAKNIQYFNVVDAAGNTLKFEKINKDSWRVSTPNIADLVVRYNYYANELNAGSTYLDEQQLYVNPVNCCVYIPSRIDEPCTVDLEVPTEYQIACALPKKKYQLSAKSFDELVESPWVASATLQRESYTVKGIEFHIWFQGTCSPDWGRILKDFKAFTIDQLKDFESFPVSEYHFINLILPYKAYHGVEHTASTVISLGPGEELMGAKMYESLLGVSSHELYHTWNIKQIRPQVMLPYDYSKENYSRMGYLYEGVTTYMGDLYLKRSNVFTDQEFYKTQEENLDKHFHNGGRSNMSVADSSFDTWLDGYVLGIPNRKVSIYTEGALCAFMLDIHILNKSGGNKSLRDLMTKLYLEYACKGKGITEEDYIHELLSFGGDKALRIIEDHIYGTKDFRASLDEVLSLVGLGIVEQNNPNILASKLGVKGLVQADGFHVKQVELNSISDQYKMAEGDVIVALNGEKVTKELLQTQSLKENVHIKLKRRFETIDIEITTTSETFYPSHKIMPLEEVSDQQKKLFGRWCS